MERKSSEFSLGSMGEALGFKDTFFYSMKNLCRPKYDYICSLGDNEYDGYNLYLDEMIAAKYKSVQNYYWLEDRGKIGRFSSFLKEEGLYAGERSYMATVVGILFSSGVGFAKHTTFIKHRNILVLFEKFKEVNKDEPWVK